MSRTEKRKNKKMLAVIIFSLIVVFLATAGTIAWLTSISTISNTFTIGSFEIPTTEPGNPSQTIEEELDGNIYEPSWDASAQHKLIPSATFEKDPYVGIGVGSEDAAVYVYVENSFSNKVYFNLNAGWEAVEAKSGSKEGTYTSGLFKYTAGLSGATTQDKWTTTPIFSTVETDEEATTTDFTVEEGQDSVIKVSSFLHQANGDEGAIDEATIEAAARAAFNIPEESQN